MRMVRFSVQGSGLPALVLLDLKLPGCGGFDVLKWIRQHPGLKALRVVMLTSSDLDQEIKTAYESGSNDFLTKPVDLERLVEMVQAASEDAPGGFSRT